MGEDKIQSYETYDGSNIIKIHPNMFYESKEDVVSNVFEDFEVNIDDAEYFKNRILFTETN